MNTPVNFELAKLLKEKGFDDECKYYYDEDEELNFHIGFIGDVWRNSEIKDGLPYDKEKHKSPCISAPTITEVIMWLYEKHWIWIETPFWDSKFRIKVVDIKNETVLRGIDFDQFNTPTEAYTAAIEYTLKKLIP